jgi:hypothetical protein
MGGKLDRMVKHAEFFQADVPIAYAELATIEDLNGNRGFSTHCAHSFTRPICEPLKTGTIKASRQTVVGRFFCSPRDSTVGRGGWCVAIETNASVCGKRRTP